MTTGTNGDPNDIYRVEPTSLHLRLRQAIRTAVRVSNDPMGGLPAAKQVFASRRNTVKRLAERGWNGEGPQLALSQLGIPRNAVKNEVAAPGEGAATHWLHDTEKSFCSIYESAVERLQDDRIRFVEPEACEDVTKDNSLELGVNVVGDRHACVLSLTEGSVTIYDIVLALGGDDVLLGTCESQRYNPSPFCWHVIAFEISQSMGDTESLPQM